MTATPPAPPRGQRPKARPPRRRTSQPRQTIFAPWRAHNSVCAADPVEAIHSGGNAATRSRRGSSAVKDVIYFNGQRYRPAFLRTNEPYARRATVPAAHLQEIGAGTRPQCHSGSRADLDHYRSVPVASIDGVSPEIAIAALPPGEHLCPSGRSRPARAGVSALGSVDDNLTRRAARGSKIVMPLLPGPGR